ncbi:MAG: 1,6-anhydro-N-acetylmuramyl-L-alanine amidase AmpD [Gammaproteobacteria bacterium]|nr:1,6-anhydro-N-acetylmuramyl-L-alanine amidase AmpD [Gammaproteobacteria bacterium]
MLPEIQHHCLRQAEFRLSPHHDERPADAAIELIVVHGISLPPGEFGGPGIDQLFRGKLDPGEHPYYAEIAHMEVSSHLLIRRDGSLVQYVPFDRRAWHAGRSEWCGRQRCNDFAIGIELEGTDDLPYTESQYEQLALCTAALITHYESLAEDAIVGHSDIAPGRKTDPGPAFDWLHFRERLRPLLGDKE